MKGLVKLLVIFGMLLGFSISAEATGAIKSVRVTYTDDGVSSTRSAWKTSDFSVERDQNTQVYVTVQTYSALENTASCKFTNTGGGTYTDTSVYHDTSEGIYYLYYLYGAKKDGPDGTIICEVDPGDVSGYTKETLTINVSSKVSAAPDLIVVNAEINDTSSISSSYEVGQTIDLSCRIENIGPGDAESTELEYYISTVRQNTYHLNANYIDDDSVSSVDSGDKSSTESDTYTLTTDDIGTRYIVFVADAGDDEDETDEDNNKTSLGPFTVVPRTPTPPYKPELSSPGDGEGGVSTLPVQLRWKEAALAQSYDVYFGDNSNPPLVEESVSELLWLTPTLSYGATYYWKVVAKNDDGETESDIWQFNTTYGIAGKPTSPVPGNNAVDCPLTQDLTWTSGGGQTVGYKVYFGTTSGSLDLLDDDCVNTSYSLPDLEYATDYYWRIDSYNGNDIVITGDEWHFKTLKEVTFPTVDAVSPSNGATGVSVDSVVFIDFSEPMAATSVEASGNITLKTPDGAVVPGTVDYLSGVGSVRAEFIPAEILSVSETYTLVIKGGADGCKDDEGQYLQSDYSSWFTVEAQGPLDYSGTIKYWNENHEAYLPIRNAKVELWDENILFDEHLGSGMTDSSGRFAFYDIDSDDVGGPDLYLKIIMDNDRIKVKPDNDLSPAYNGKTDTQGNVTVSQNALIQISKDDTEVNGAAHIFCTAQDIAQWYSSFDASFSNIVPKVTYYVDESEGTSIFHGAGLFLYLPNVTIYQDDWWDVGIIAHEYSHAVMYSYYGNRLPPRGDYESHRFSQETDRGFAFMEGWAEFVQGVYAMDRDGFDWTGSLHSSGVFQIEQYGDIFDFFGDDHAAIEGNVAAVLWDIYDGPSTKDEEHGFSDGATIWFESNGVDDDNIHVGFQKIFNVIKESPDSIYEFWDVYTNRYPEDTQELAQIYLSHELDANVSSTVELVVSSAYGAPTPSGTSSYNIESAVTASIESPDGGGSGVRHVCIGYTGTGSALSGSGTSCAFTISQNSTLIWNWSTQYLSSASATINGSISPSGSTWADAGADIEYAATANSGYQVDRWEVNGIEVAQNVLGYTLSDLSEPSTIAVYFSEIPVGQYTLSFDSAGGTAVDQITQEAGTTLTAPAAPTRIGYTFEGWSPAISATMPASNLTVTAQWNLNDYTLIFDGAGGTTVGPITQDYGTAVTPPSDPTKTGYTFTGWIPAVPSTMPASNLTVTAQWEAVPVSSYALTVENGTGDGSYTNGAVINIAADTAPSGQVFSGWSVIPDEYAGNVADTNEASTTFTMPVTNVMITANYTTQPSTYLFEETFENLDRWTLWGSPAPLLDTANGYPAPSFNNHGDASYDSGAISQQTFDFSNGLIVEADAYQDRFGVWQSFVIGLAKKGSYGSSDGASMSVGIRARHDNGDKTQCYVAYSETETEVFELYDPSTDWRHYRFVIRDDLLVEFYKEDTLLYTSTNQLDMAFNNMPIVLGSRARYSPVLIDNIKVSSYQSESTLSFVSTGGSEVAPISQNPGTEVTAPADPTRLGYTFAGWVPEVPTLMPSSNLTVMAQWTINQYALSFDSAGGSVIDPMIQDYGTSITSPVAPIRVGYTFIGWDPAIPETMLASNLTVMADWMINQYTLTFNSDGGTALDPITQDYGTAVTPPVAPSRSGYVFTGWLPEIPATMPATNLTITAHYSPVEINVFSGFVLTQGKYLDSSDWNAAVESEFGADYRVADWNDLVSYYSAGGDLIGLYDGLGLTNYQDSASVTRSGDPSYTSTRYYYASRHEHNKPGNYLAHANIDSYLLSLGSWSGTRNILAIHKLFDPVRPESTVVSSASFKDNGQNGVSLKWHSIPNRYYTLWATDNLATNDWYPVVPHTNGTSAGGTMQATVSNLNHSAEFFKIEISTDPVEIPLAFHDAFDGATYDGWSYRSSTPAYGSSLVQIDDGSLHINRWSAGGSGQNRGIERSFDITVTSSLKVSFDVYPVSSSVRNGTGDNNGEYPAMVLLLLDTPEGERYLSFAYSQISSSKPDRTWDTGYQVSNTQVSGWLRGESYRVHDYFPTATKIKSVRLYGAGWDFESYFDNLSISY